MRSRNPKTGIRPKITSKTGDREEEGLTTKMPLRVNNSPT